MRRVFSARQWLLALFSVAAFFEAAFWGQLGAFAPLFLPELGVAPGEVTPWVGVIASIASLVGLPSVSVVRGPWLRVRWH